MLLLDILQHMHACTQTMCNKRLQLNCRGMPPAQKRIASPCPVDDDNRHQG